MTQKQILLAILLKIQKEGPTCPEEGICYNVEFSSDAVPDADVLEMNHIMDNLFRVWPEFSGNDLFPVPYTEDGERCADPDSAFYGTDDLWIEEYGDTRKRLLAFMIDELQKDSE